jgi:hypothetical protein
VRLDTIQLSRSIMRLTIATSLVVVGAAVSLAACSFSTDTSDRLDIENDLPISIIVKLDSGGGALLAPNSTQRFSRGGHHSVT